MENFGVIVVCSKNDFFYAKGTVASIRYFMPNVPICLLTDGSFDLDHIPEIYNTIVLKNSDVKNDFLRENSFGWGFTKMVAFWESPFENFLLIDADTVVWGDMEKHADFDNYDFIIDKPEYNYSIENIDQYYFNTKKMTEIFPSFSYEHNPYVCTGVIFGKRNLLDVKIYQKLFEMKASTKDLFFCAEQGLLNFMFFDAQQKGKIRLKNEDTQYIIPDFKFEQTENKFPIPPPSTIHHPVVIHWAGETKPLIHNNKLVYAEPMTFFRKLFLSDKENAGFVQEDGKLLTEEHIYFDNKAATKLAQEKELQKIILKSRIRKLFITIIGETFFNKLKGIAYRIV